MISHNHTHQTTCLLFDGDEGKCDVILSLKRVTASLSMIGCTFMILIIWLFGKYKFLSQRLIIWLSTSAVFNALAYVIGDRTEKGPQCSFEAFMIQFFDWSVLMWVMCITFNLYWNVAKKESSERFERYYHIISWLIPLFISAIPLFGNHYGPAGVWCWIEHEAMPWRFILWYVPLWIIVIGMFLVYTYTYVVVRRRVSGWQGNGDPDQQRSNESLMRDVKSLMAYPFIYMLLSFFPFVLRIHNAFTNEGTDIYVLWILTVLSAPLQGAVNSVAFGFDPETRSRLTMAELYQAISIKLNRKQNTVKEYSPQMNANQSVASIPSRVDPEFIEMNELNDDYRTS